MKNTEKYEAEDVPPKETEAKYSFRSNAPLINSVQASPLQPDKQGERLSEESTEKLLSLLRTAPAGSYVTTAGTLGIIEALHADKLFLKAVIAKHEANMQELKEAYGIEVVPDEAPGEPSAGTDPKSLYSIL
jgi:hypothetical protein